jgi:WW domain-binding protein 4
MSLNFSSSMSEYWISKKKYFCTYCDIFIADDAPSRAHHENGMRHQGNKERFVKSLYKAGEKRKKDEEEERREMRHVEAAAERAYALDVGAGRAGIGGSGPSRPTPKAPPPSKKPSNPYANYTTAQFLGYNDPDAERIQAGLERKRSKPPSDGGVAVLAGTKREADVPAVDDDDSRAWKLRKKTARLEEIYDPGAIPIKLKVKKEPDAASTARSNTAATNESRIVPANSTERKATDVPKWTKVEWKRPGDSDLALDRTSTGLPSIPTEPASPHEHPQSPPPSSPAPKTEPASVKLEDPSLSDLPSNGGTGGSLFKKRKGKPSAAGAVRGQRDQF